MMLTVLKDRHQDLCKLYPYRYIMKYTVANNELNLGGKNGLGKDWMMRRKRYLNVE